MKPNLGIIDRVIRLALGAALIAAPLFSGMALFAPGTATIISIVLGIVMLATSSMRFCPLYRIVGIQTCKL